jgi:O-antigen/teichoic acid export membrane protein
VFSMAMSAAMESAAAELAKGGTTSILVYLTPRVASFFIVMGLAASIGFSAAVLGALTSWIARWAMGRRAGRTRTVRATRVAKVRTAPAR